MALAESSQSRFLVLEELENLPRDDRRYVPALQNKPGELQALRDASEDVWAQMTPLLQLVGPKSRRKEISIGRVKGWVKRAAGAVGEHPIYLDVLRVRPNRTVVWKDGRKSRLLTEIFAAARKRRMKAIPVIWAGTSNKTHIKLVTDALGNDGFGVGVRYRMRSVSFPPGQSAGEYLDELLGSLGATPECTDLLIDLEYLDPDVEIAPEDITDRLLELGPLDSWRSVVLLGTSIPKSLSSIKEDTVGKLPRTELEIWRGLRKLSRPIAFGDYAIQHPHPPADSGGGGFGPWANLRYTVADRVIVHRGQAVMTEGSGQYRNLCASLVSEPEFEGPRFSAGDRIFYDCARGLIRPGAQKMWRGAGTSHHIRFVTRQLLQEPSWKSAV